MDSQSKIQLELKGITVCRCCLKDGFTDLSSDCFGSSEKESFEDILKLTFNIQLSPLLNDSKSLICDGCARSLRVAHSFRAMVLQSEETLVEYMRSMHCSDADIKACPVDILKDSIKIETADIYDTNCHSNFNDSADDNEILANLKVNAKIEDFDVRKRKGNLERKLKSKRCKIKEKSDKELNLPEKDWIKISERRGKGPLLRDNSLKLIQNSNLCVFQWNKSQYRCFCCNTPFTNINNLKQHTFEKHTIENIEKKIILQQNRLVKVEISNLECKLCSQKLDSISTLKRHLSTTHSIGLDEDLLVPFKIEEELKCQICFEKFSVFRLLNIHINRHFQKQICHICGAGFSNLVFLNLHKTRSHRPFICKGCDLTFVSKTEKNRHDITVHGLKCVKKLRFPCTFCPERFSQENLKILHMVDRHGLSKPDFRCDICTKSFITRSLCNNHIKNVHNKEKNHECDVCHHFFYTKSDVVRHRVTHTGEKKFSCHVCSNPFASKDSLRRHVKRTHIGVK